MKVVRLYNSHDRKEPKPLRIISFTQKGCTLARRIAQKIPARLYARSSLTGSYLFRPDDDMEEIHCPLESWAAEGFRNGEPLLFIGASGIAVRAIAPSLKNKLEDVPVLVMDIRGQYVIPILSGHYGGANRLAKELAELMGATPVITTATDLTGAFAPDLFALRNGMKIRNPGALPRVSGKAVAGETLRIRNDLPIPIVWEDGIPEGVEMMAPEEGEADICITCRNISFEIPTGVENVFRTDQTVYMIPGLLHVGIGCKRGIDPNAFFGFFDKVFHDQDLLPDAIASVASIDRKEDEEAILQLVQKLQLPFVVYTAEELARAEGTFPESAFVEETVGVGNVSARAAALSAGNDYRMLSDRITGTGMTMALAMPAKLRLVSSGE